MTTLQQYITDVQYLVHDSSGANFTQSQLTNFINQARYQTALDTHCVRKFLPNLNTITKQETYIYNGTIGGVLVTAGGANYSSSPSVTIVGGGGTGATASAVVTAGVITNIFMTNWGNGDYTSQPTVSITDGTGSGAAGTATYLSNVLDILSISVLWGNLRVMLGWLPFTQFQAWLRAYTFMFSQPDGVWTAYTAANKVYTYPISDQPYIMEWDVITTPTPLINLNDNDVQVTAPWDTMVKYFAAFLCLASLQNYEMANYWYDGKGNGKYDILVKRLPATTYSRRIFNPYATGVARIKRMR